MTARNGQARSSDVEACERARGSRAALAAARGAGGRRRSTSRVVWLDAVGSGLPSLDAAAADGLLRPGGAALPARGQRRDRVARQGLSLRRRRFEELDLVALLPDPRRRQGEALRSRALLLPRERRVLAALDASSATPRRKRGDPIGGVMIMSLRAPIAEPGSDEPRYRRLPVDQIAAVGGAALLVRHRTRPSARAAAERRR